MVTKKTRKPSVSRKDRDLIKQIVVRAQDVYRNRFNEKRLTAGLLAAHRANPIRLDDLLHTCYFDFYSDVVDGVYKHYDPKTDSMKNNWKAQHSVAVEDEDDLTTDDVFKFLERLLG